MTRRRALAIGCGGTLGFAWTAVALRALEEELDWDPRTAAVLLGTSAGSEAVAAIGAGRTPQDLLDALERRPGADPVLSRHLARAPGRFPPVPAPSLPGLGLARATRAGRSSYAAGAALLPRGRGDATFLRDYAAALTDGAPWVDHPATWLVAADATTGEQVPFGAPGAPRAVLGEALAASWAIPGWFPPVEVAGRRYLDGGAVASVSADLLADAPVDEVVVVAPMTTEGGVPATGADRVERVLRRRMTAGLDREVAALRAAGIRVVRIEPGAEELAAMGPNFMDPARRAATLEAARRAVPARVATAVVAADRGASA
ncbi:patatin-like phospholipase family protein [Nocardioides panacisoli]|uniref:patatin-like phospholipase family protein n=1 Tax=Nocardioides panacisoli TaxID=627624 RepID=UPI001C62577F|nr:patatin-like phospholipase family protein [Nocardioides panacisoli]QYJ03303.1 patatin-like phospholipase family protein [Nocardioides panacisoli]